MGLRSKISWTHSTWNPWIGCTEVSPACDHCYARKLMADRYGRVEWGRGKMRIRTSATTWNDPMRLNREAQRVGSRRLMFTASLADICDAEVPVEWFAAAMNVMLEAPMVDVLFLTKRPHLIREKITNGVQYAMQREELRTFAVMGLDFLHHGKPFPNIRFGTTVESQDFVHRLKHLCDLPAHLLFVSAEPLLGPLNLRKAHLTPEGYTDYLAGIRYFTDPKTLAITGTERLKNRIGQVIVGGESGDNQTPIRPMHPAWPISLREQCREGNAAFFFKQWGEWIPRALAPSLGIDPAADFIDHWEFTDGTKISRVSFPKRHKIDDLLQGKRFHYVPGYVEQDKPSGPEFVSHGLKPLENFFETASCKP